MATLREFILNQSLLPTGNTVRDHIQNPGVSGALNYIESFAVEIEMTEIVIDIDNPDIVLEIDDPEVTVEIDEQEITVEVD